MLKPRLACSGTTVHKLLLSVASSLCPNSQSCSEGGFQEAQLEAGLVLVSPRISEARGMGRVLALVSPTATVPFKTLTWVVLEFLFPFLEASSQSWMDPPVSPLQHQRKQRHFSLGKQTLTTLTWGFLTAPQVSFSLLHTAPVLKWKVTP